MNILKQTTFIGILVLVITTLGCGGGDKTEPENNPPPPLEPTLTGVFIDSTVSGLSYKTATKSGLTDSIGRFEYIDGEDITFSVGDLVLGIIKARPIVTPLDLVPNALDFTDPTVINIVQILLTLDVDSDPSNGIEISSTAHIAATGLTITIDTPSFDIDILALVKAVKGAGSTIVVDSIASDHVIKSLKTTWGTMAWGTDCWIKLCG